MDMDREYQNAAFIPDGQAYPARWAEDAAAFRLAARMETVAYGDAPRQAMDIFLPEGTPAGLLVFIHGGYWLRFDRRDFSHLAAGALARGWACAMPSYTLAPEARIAAMVAEVARGTSLARAQIPGGPLVITGHSAGGHLAARMACADQNLPLARVLPVSPLADLAPLMQTAMNLELKINAAEAASESPARLPLRPAIDARVWVGGQERPAFLWHARTLSEAWSCPWTVAPGRHHFDVIADLTDPASALMQALLGGL
jgi:arylformamidase